MLVRIADYFNMFSFVPISSEECEMSVIISHLTMEGKAQGRLIVADMRYLLEWELLSYFLDFYGKDAIFLQ